MTMTAVPDTEAHLDRDLADIGQPIAGPRAPHPGCLRPAAGALRICPSRPV